MTMVILKDNIISIQEILMGFLGLFIGREEFMKVSIEIIKMDGEFIIII